MYVRATGGKLLSRYNQKDVGKKFLSLLESELEIKSMELKKSKS